MKRLTVAVMECLDQASHKGDESFLPIFGSLSCTETPSSPMALSPSSPRVSLRDFREYTLRNVDKTQVYLPPINARRLIQPLYPLPSFPLTNVSLPTYKRASPGMETSKNDTSDNASTYDRTITSPPFSLNTLNFSMNLLRPHAFDKINSNQRSHETLSALHPIHPTPNQQSIPRPAGNPPMAIVITQPIATICEVPGFKRRGRPSTRMDNQCVECGTHRTPEWRRGEGGVHLCNACGLQYSKRIRRERAEKKRNAITAVLNLDV